MNNITRRTNGHSASEIHIWKKEYTGSENTYFNFVFTDSKGVEYASRRNALDLDTIVTSIRDQGENMFKRGWKNKIPIRSSVPRSEQSLSVRDKTPRCEIQEATLGNYQITDVYHERKLPHHQLDLVKKLISMTPSRYERYCEKRSN